MKTINNSMSKFNALKVGDLVKLSSMRADYTCGHKTPDGRVYIPAGAVGTIGAVGVPAVSTNRKFACVDFERSIQLVDCKGRPVEHWDTKNGYRCAVFATDLI